MEKSSTRHWALKWISVIGQSSAFAHAHRHHHHHLHRYHRHHHHHDNIVELQGSVCGSIATAATRPSALPAQTLNTGSMALSGNNEDDEDEVDNEDDEDEDNEDEGEDEEDDYEDEGDGEDDEDELEVSKPLAEKVLS